jgi:peptidoglycan/xylan/chitin deacetylase (PgdA/CDA1 family)
MALKALKVGVLKHSKSIGLFAALGRSPWRTNRLLILGYHGISLDDEHLWNPGLFISQEVFRQRLELLVQARCSVLSLRDGLSRLAKRDLPPRSVVITFDDGYYDFFARAYPVIREFGFPVTVYQTSYYSSYNRPIFDVACSYLLWKGARTRITSVALTGIPGVLDLTTNASRLSAGSRMLETAQRAGMSAEDKDELLERLAASLELDAGLMRTKRLLHLMKPEELRQLVTQGVDLQLHTHRHRMPRDRDLFIREIVDNRELLAAVGQPSTDHFCYPSGVYGECFLPWLAELGVQSATTCDLGLASSKTRMLLLPRLLDSSTLSVVEFEGWLCGMGHVLPGRPTRRELPPADPHPVRMSS